MINLYQARTNTITIYDLYSKVTIPDASLHYLFNFRDFYNSDVNAVLIDRSSYPDRYSTFYFTDGSDGTLRASGEYNIYESPIDSSTIDASIMNLLENGQYTFVKETDSDVYYDPSLFDYKGYDVVFDPLFSTGTGSVTSFPHDDLTDRNSKSNHPWALAEASLGSQFYWQDGSLYVTDTSGGGGGDYDASIADLWSYNAIQDASILALEASIGTSMDYPYVDGSLAARDASIDALFLLAETQDPSIPYLYDYTLDLSTRIDNIGPGTQDASIADLYNITEDLSTRIDGIPTDVYTISQVDSSFALKTEIPTDFYSQAYVDGSLNAKQDIIPDGTFVKEASLGAQFYWQDGSLFVTDVSGVTPDVTKSYVDGSLGLRDTSIAYLDVYVTDLSTYVYTHTHSQDASIADLYQEIADIPQDPSISDLYDTKADKTEIPTDFYSQAYVDGSLATRDSSIATNTSAISINSTSISDVSTRTYILEQIDASARIYQNTLDIAEVSSNIPTDFYSQAYVDGSLNAKQDLIPDGTFLKEASIGSGLEWNAGALDVSIDMVTSLVELTDVSISSIATNDILQYDPSGSSPNKWRNQPPADATQWFYTKDEIDSMLLQIIGGTYGS